MRPLYNTVRVFSLFLLRGCFSLSLPRIVSRHNSHAKNISRGFREIGPDRWGVHRARGRRPLRAKGINLAWKGRATPTMMIHDGRVVHGRRQVKGARGESINWRAQIPGLCRCERIPRRFPTHPRDVYVKETTRTALFSTRRGVIRNSVRALQIRAQKSVRHIFSFERTATTVVFFS